jgi:uncharacterized protein (DUF2235 family)
MPEAVNEVPVSDNMNAIRAAGKPRRLVLCFDGTSNKFQGDRSDTNIVKIYQMLDRNTSDQFHYYQRKADHYSDINMVLTFYSRHRNILRGRQRERRVHQVLSQDSRLCLFQSR